LPCRIALSRDGTNHVLAFGDAPLRGIVMPKVVFTHAVNDPAFWLSKHSERVAMFASWGTIDAEYSSPDDGKTVAIALDVHDMAAMQTALGSAEVAAAKQAHGVIDPVTMLVEKS